MMNAHNLTYFDYTNNDLNLVECVYDALVNNNINSNVIEDYKNNQLTKTAKLLSLDKQTNLLNRFWKNYFCNIDLDTSNISFLLPDFGSPQQWLNEFIKNVIPMLIVYSNKRINHGF